MTYPVCLLGPQRPDSNLAGCLEMLEVEGPVVSITAGWQEWESDSKWLQSVIGHPVIDLALHSRAEAVFARDPELFHAHRERQNRLIVLQRLYRSRLGHMLAAVRDLQTMNEPSTLRGDAMHSAISAVRALDRQHIRQLRKVHAAFWAERLQSGVVELDRAREAVRHEIERANAVIIAGGHVAVLVNRLKLFDLGHALRSRPLLAWSAGAMALCSRIVLFHDHPPQGAGDPEVLDDGLGLVSGIVALPHAQRRLSLQDKQRVSIFARRFAPDLCATLDSGALIQVQDEQLEASESVRCLHRNGQLVALKR